MMIDWWILIYQLLGGLALFLFGMDVMTKSLKSSAGNQLKAFLHRMTSNRWKAMVAGTGITAVIQSSSVTTVLAVGFVSAGIMTFESTLGVILGANIGTTITAQIIAFKVTKIALFLVIVGYLIHLISNKKSHREIGKIFVGLGLIFLGMNIMSEGMHPLKSYPPFLETMQNLSHPIYGILIGAAFTALVQSSSATTGIVIVLASQGLISTQGGISIIIGANIGTCVTAFLSAIGKPRAAMQVAMAHIFFKVIGAILWVWFIPQLAEITTEITPKDIARQIANAHTIFNVSNAFLLIGFTKPIAKLITKLVPVKKSEQEKEILLLNNYYLQNPSMAIELVDKELKKLSKNTEMIFKTGLDTIFTGSMSDLEALRKSDKKIDFRQTQILSYLQQLQQEQLKKKESKRIKHQMEITNILEAAADVVTTDMVEAAEHRSNYDLPISDETKAMFNRIYQQSINALAVSFEAYYNNNTQLAKLVMESKKPLKKHAFELKNHLIDRLSKQDANRIAIIRFESEIVELTVRLHSLGRRIARLQLNQDSSS
ncbi:Na/Pi cotransporter family protein [Labilibacter marinus]|uniref:Na/Pi cotransporter family protein n=1 Tax=Labilibacter marinus TaxID=1477105 RepID=UPI00094FFAEE|nr:Na/Pi cotransporter family protein [Labilibacter marinus]